MSIFFCYRHVINKFGASTPLGKIVRELLFSYCQEEYKEKLEKYEPVLKEILKKSKTHLKQFQNLFNIQLDPNTPIRNYTEQSLWIRKDRKVGTCSNHIESSHQKLNFKVLGNMNVNERFIVLLKYLSGRFSTVKVLRNAHDAIDTLRRIRKKTNFGKCNDHCNEMKDFYSNLFGFDFPCVHSIEMFDESKVPEFPEIVAEPFLSYLKRKLRIVHGIFVMMIIKNLNSFLVTMKFSGQHTKK